MPVFSGVSAKKVRQGKCNFPRQGPPAAQIRTIFKRNGMDNHISMLIAAARGRNSVPTFNASFTAWASALTPKVSVA